MFRCFCMIFIFISLLISCNEENSDVNKEKLNDCDQILILAEDCMGLHRGALAYVESCGNLSLDQLESYNTCDDLLNYLGLSK